MNMVSARLGSPSKAETGGLSSTTVAALYAVACGAVLLFALPEYSFSNRALGSLLLICCTAPLVRYIQKGSGVPLIELPLATYAVFFTVPLFVESEHPVFRGVIRPENGAIDIVLLSAILSVLAGFSGFSACKHFFSETHFSLLARPPSHAGLVAVAFTLLGINLLFRVGGLSVDSSWSRTIQVLFSQELAIGILALLYYQGKLSKRVSTIAIGLLFLVTAQGIVTGMTQNAIQPLFVCVLCRWIVLRKFPVYFLVVGVVLVLFLQPIKHEYRKRFWFSQGRETVSTPEKLVIYGQIAGDYWFSSTKDSAESASERLKFSITQRFSLLLFTQRYVQWTPERISYKGGESIYYVLYGWIPRKIWPDKPVANLANQRYPIEYGIQHPKTARTASFGVGHVAEVYVNFGILGIVPVFFLLGALAYAPMLFGRGTGNAAVTSIQVVSAVNLMFIGSTIGSAYGGLISQIIAQTIIFVVATRVFGPEQEFRRVS